MDNILIETIDVFIGLAFIIFHRQGGRMAFKQQNRLRQRLLHKEPYGKSAILLFQVAYLLIGLLFFAVGLSKLLEKL
jgi:hypothetical protein